MRILICEDITGGFHFWKKINSILLNSYYNMAEISALGESEKTFYRQLENEKIE